MEVFCRVPYFDESLTLGKAVFAECFSLPSAAVSKLCFFAECFFLPSSWHSRVRMDADRVRAMRSRGSVHLDCSQDRVVDISKATVNGYGAAVGVRGSGGHPRGGGESLRGGGGHTRCGGTRDKRCLQVSVDASAASVPRHWWRFFSPPRVDVVWAANHSYTHAAKCGRRGLGVNPLQTMCCQTSPKQIILGPGKIYRPIQQQQNRTNRKEAGNLPRPTHGPAGWLQ